MHPDPAETNRRAYDDARVAALYDLDNPPGEDHAYFRRAAEESGARRIVDLGCGTGSLTVTLTGDDRAVVGIDPAEAMLRVARARPGGDRVEWRRGTAELIEPASADLVIMSGNVAMHLIGQDWHDALQRIAAGLAPGGRLLFETRNPVRRAWEDWQQEPTERTTAAGRPTRVRAHEHAGRGRRRRAPMAHRVLGRGRGPRLERLARPPIRRGGAPVDDHRGLSTGGLTRPPVMAG